MSKTKGTNRWLQLLVISAGAGIIYQLPYLRYAYYDAMIKAFEVTNAQLGTMMSMFGLIMIFAYFPGGWLSDRYSNKLIMSLGQILTGAAGLWFATFPAYPIALGISIFWSFSTATLFWTCMVGVTRSLGNENEQGRIFGLLEAGRGLFPILLGFIVVPVFSALGEGVEALRAVILIYAISGIVMGIISFFVLKDPVKAPVKPRETKEKPKGSYAQAVKNPYVWLIALIFFCTMNLFITLGYITPYLTSFMGCSESVAAIVGLIRTWGLMLGGGILGGFIADKFTTSKTLIASFAVILIGFLAMTFIPTGISFLYVAIFASLAFGLGIYVNRAIYFATMTEVKIPLELTGAATAIITAVGGSPDAFLYTIIGSWLDKYPDGLGYKYVFIYSAVSAAVGIIVTTILMKKIKQVQSQEA